MSKHWEWIRALALVVAIVAAFVAASEVQKGKYDQERPKPSTTSHR